MSLKSHWLLQFRPNLLSITFGKIPLQIQSKITPSDQVCFHDLLDIRLFPFIQLSNIDIMTVFRRPIGSRWPQTVPSAPWFSIPLFLRQNLSLPTHFIKNKKWPNFTVGWFPGTKNAFRTFCNPLALKTQFTNNQIFKIVFTTKRFDKRIQDLLHFNRLGCRSNFTPVEWKP